MRHSQTILSFIILIAFSACSNPKFSDENMEIKALDIANKLDSNSIKTFYEWGFGQRGEMQIFTKNSDNPNNGFCSYGCHYTANKDTIKLRIYDFNNFIKDFPCTLQIDSSKNYTYYFIKYSNSYVRVSTYSNDAQHNSLIDSIPLKELFPTNDPFKKFKTLSELTNSLGIIGNSYRTDMGNYIEFYLSRQHILTYLPDSLYLNPKSKEVRLKEFAKGKTIKKNWNLRKLDKPMDNG